MIIKIILPIYIKHRKKNVLVGMNVFRNLHYTTKNKWKRAYHDMVIAQLKPLHQINFDGEISCSHKLYYKNSNCDMNNICSLVDKFTMDALQEFGVIKNDNVTRYNSYKATVTGQDKSNPRVEIRIKIPN